MGQSGLQKSLEFPDNIKGSLRFQCQLVNIKIQCRELHMF